MTRLTTLLLFLFALSASAQKLTVESLSADPMDLSAAKSPVTDLNGKACALVKVRLAADGATFEGNIIKTVKNNASEYWVYVIDRTYMLTVSCPGYLPLDINFRDYGVQGVKSKQTYVLTLLRPDGVPVPTDDGMRYLVLTVSPQSATVYIDGQPQVVQGGTASVRLPRGQHSYRVEAAGYATKDGTVELAEGRKAVTVTLESALAGVTVTCPTAGSQIYVNDALKGASPWSGELVKGNYLFEARKDGYRTQSQSVTLAERERRTVSLPELVAITGSIDVNYQPANAEVWIDGKKAGLSPDIFRNIPVGHHNVTVQADGYEVAWKPVEVAEGQTTAVSGQLSPTPTATTSSSITSVGSKLPVPEAVDLGLSVKWASFNLGASKPEEYGRYYKWGETERADGKGWATYKYGKGSFRVTKYCSESLYGYNGFTDGKTILDAVDDAATVNLGGAWRMPTETEIEELRSNCTREWTKIGGVYGIRVTGRNGNSIFFPTAGYRNDSGGSFSGVGSDGFYWSTKGRDSSGRAFHFYSRGWELDWELRVEGCPIRPVLGK